jgi:hypothetical protein
MKNSNIRWPNQHRPSKGGWLVWRLFLGSFSNINRYMFQPLGSWKYIAVLHHDHEWYIATPQRALIQKRGNQWFLHERQGRGIKYYSSQPRVLISPPTLRSIAQVKVHGTFIECIDDIVISQPLIQHISFPCPWRTQYESLTSHLRRIIGPCPPPPKLFQTLPSSTNIRSASDESFLHCLGYQRWLIATLDNDILLEGLGATDGIVEDTHSNMAGLCGNIATFSILNIIRRVYGFAQPPLSMYATTNGLLPRH